MDRIIAKAKENVQNVRQTTTHWARQKILAAVGSNSHHTISECATSDCRSSDVRPCDNNPDQWILFKASPLPNLPIIRDATSINISSVKQLGQVHSNSTYVKRDLGFSGQIGSYILLSYGDTLYTDKSYSDTFRGIVSNSIAFATKNPIIVIDPLLDNNGYPCQFVKINPSWGEDQSTHAIGITSVIETCPNEGVVFTLLNHRPNGTDNLLGAGLAKVTLDTSTNPPTPSANRLSQLIWNGDTEPWYGDVCTFKSPLDNYIYAYGHKKDSPFVYVARVPAVEATNINCYEYFHGPEQGWRSERLVSVPKFSSSGANTTTNTNSTSTNSTISSHLNSNPEQKADLAPPDETQSIFWQINQGQIFYSTKFSRFIFIYCDNFWSSTILLRWSHLPEGPWSEAQTVYKATPITEGGNVYAAAVHDYFDLNETVNGEEGEGKEENKGMSLVVTFTNYPNVIEAIKVVFE